MKHLIFSGLCLTSDDTIDTVLHKDRRWCKGKWWMHWWGNWRATSQIWMDWGAVRMDEKKIYSSDEIPFC